MHTIQWVTDTPKIGFQGLVLRLEFVVGTAVAFDSAGVVAH